jgi:flagellar biogenesis protein FliO
MKEFFDTIIVILFVLFLVWIFRGYHLSKRQDDES